MGKGSLGSASVTTVKHMFSQIGHMESCPLTELYINVENEAVLMGCCWPLLGGSEDHQTLSRRRSRQRSGPGGALGASGG